MSLAPNFWLGKTLEDFSPAEWEALCDGCGQCCLYKLDDHQNNGVLFTNVACRFLDLDTCQCIAYPTRKSAMPTCVRLTPEKVREIDWLPPTCAYRLIMEGKPLADWHPLISGDPESVHRAGISVQSRAISENQVDMKELDKYVI